MERIKKIVNNIRDNNDIRNVAKLNIEIFRLYKITKEEIEYIFQRYPTNDIIKSVLKEL